MYPGDNPIQLAGLTFMPQYFTCALTGVKLTLKTVTVHDGEVYLKGKEPNLKPTQVGNVIDERVARVPDSNMRTSDRMFNVAGKATARGCTDADAGSSYGAGAVVVDTQIAAPKVPTTVNNINLQEKLHNGVVKYTAVDGSAAE